MEIEIAIHNLKLTKIRKSVCVHKGLADFNSAHQADRWIDFANIWRRSFNYGRVNAENRGVIDKSVLPPRV